MKRIVSAKLFVLIFFILPYMMFSSSAIADTKKPENLPERSIRMAVEYSSVIVPNGEEVSMDIIFHNRGRSDEDVLVDISEKPDTWKARIKTYRFDVRGVHVPSGEDKTLTFEAEPDKGLEPGTFQFLITGKTADGSYSWKKQIEVTTKKKEDGSRESKGVKMTTSYPVLRGPSDGKFEFSVEVESKLDKDAIFDLMAQPPEGWEVNFKPAYESKFISSLRIKAGQSSTVAVEVKPGLNAEEGEYPVHFRVASGDAKAEADLKVILTGTYDLEVGTSSGLLSLDARQGKPANISFYIRNKGSAVNRDIKFMSFKPENWKVEFKPEKVEAIKAGDLSQVEMVITPYEEALVGDYSISVQVEGEKVTKELEFRVTVKASSAWEWLGIAIIAIVVLGLSLLFRKLGRR